MSVTRTDPSSGMWLADPPEVVVTERSPGDDLEQRPLSTRVTVKSHSIPPRRLSICVYVTAPTARATRLSHRCSRNSAAPGPTTSILANEDSSNSAAVSRAARCSAAIAGDQCIPAQPRGRSDSCPQPALLSYQLTRSHPDFSPNAAAVLDGASRTREDVRNGRPARPFVARDSECRSRSRTPRGPARACSAGSGSAPRSGGCPCARRRATAPQPMIHSAITSPIPPAPAKPCAQNPAATKNPRTSLSPRQNSLSG